MIKNILLLLIALNIALYSNDSNKTKELENWLRYGFTNGDISFIVEYIQKIERQNYILQKRIVNLENSILSQNKIIKEFILQQKRDKKTKNSHKIKEKQKKFYKKSDKIIFKYIKPKSFVAKQGCLIYDRPDSEVVLKLKENMLFTSNIVFENWIKITGYFPNGKWQRVDKSWWIKEKCILKVR